jgi:hypothetical protein
MTKRQIERFIRKRNKSPFASNLQFQIDEKDCGIKLGPATKVRDGLYEWKTRFGKIVEERGILRLEASDCTG